MGPSFRLVRVGRFYGDIKSALSKYYKGLNIFIPPETGCIFYGFAIKSNGHKCYIMVSEKYLVFSRDKPNISISVQSQDQEENRKTIRDLESILGIALKPPSRSR
jgi:hypothetical protein